MADSKDKDGDDPAAKNDAQGKDDDKGSDDKKDGDEKEDDKKDGDKKDDKGGDDKKESPLKNPKVRIGLVIGGIVLLIVAIIWFINYRNYGRFQQKTDDAYLGADQVNVSIRVSGYIVDVRVDDNQPVEAGQLLAKIESRDYSGRIDQALGTIAQAEAQVVQAEAQIRQQQAEIDQRRAQVRQSDADIRQYLANQRFNESEVARYTPLAESGAEPAEKLAQYVANRDQARAQVDSARAQRDAAIAQMAYSRRQIDVYKAQIGAAEGQLLSGRGSLASSQVDFEATSVLAPIAGRVADRRLRVGQFVQAGTRLLTIVPTQQLYLTANFKETQIGLIRVGQPASITVDALPGADIRGTVESFQPGTGNRFALVPQDNATGNFTKIVQRVPVRISVDADPATRRVLVPGLSVNVSVDTRGAEDDSEAVKREKKEHEDRREKERKDAVERGRKNPASGAGGG